MATTAGGTPYVESSDLVANYPAVSLALAEHIDGLPQKIVQIVRATDLTSRATTSTSFTDVTGVSVTITPTQSDSTILIGLFGSLQLTWTTESVYQYAHVQITDSANTGISGAQDTRFGRIRARPLSDPVWWFSNLSMFAYASPATTSAVTYKARFKVAPSSTGVTLTINSDYSTTQLFAIEVGA